MNWLSDEAVTRLRAVTDRPDFTATRYRIVCELARGGMGVIYEAVDEELQRSVALKVLATELASPEAAERMRGEARVIAKLEHPGIVPLHDVGTLPDGRIFYAMKLVRGRRLDELTLPATEALRTFLRLAEAVAFAHARDVTHCDLKPQNVMVGTFGEVLVLDWGLARRVGAASRETVIAGTYGYMAPEQERGAAAHPTADVFALGAILSSLVAAAQQNRTSPPRALRAVIEKASAIDPRQRYQNAGEMADDVARYIDGEPVLAHRETLPERAARWLSRNRALVGVVVAYLLMRGVVIFFTYR